MNDPLTIECEWWGSSNGENDLSQICRGAIGIHVGDDCLTRLEDSWGNTTRNRLNASAYTLAHWFAGNWWRLRWEPETPGSQRDVDWRMSHSLASAGEGYCWPSILFASDGESIAVASRATRGRVMGPVRYLNQVNTRMSARAFESGIDAFLTLVLSRLHAEGHGSNELAELWAEVQKERRDPELANCRRLEALCGYDPGEAPEELIKALLSNAAGLGAKALEEVAAQGRHGTTALITSITNLARSGGNTVEGGFPGMMRRLKAMPRFQTGDRPWERAAELAHAARREWGLGNQPVSNQMLADLMGTGPEFLATGSRGPAPMPIVIQDPDSDRCKVYLQRAHPTSRRFAAARLLGDYLDVANGESLIPATNAKTSRQQFQRAFAQEFLCPYEALMQKIQTSDPDDDDIWEASAHFQVSTRVIETIFVNKGELDRETLHWTT